MIYSRIQTDSLDEILEYKGQKNKAVQRSGSYLVAIPFDAPAEVSELTWGSVQGTIAPTLARDLENHDK